MKEVDFSETIAACDLKVGRCRHLIELMAQGHLHMKLKTCFSQKPLGHFNQILYVSFRVNENENL